MLLKSLLLLPAALNLTKAPLTLMDAKVSHLKDVKIGMFSDIHI